MSKNRSHVIEKLGKANLDNNILDDSLVKDYELLNVLYFPQEDDEKLHQSFAKLITIVNSYYENCSACIADT